MTTPDLTPTGLRELASKHEYCAGRAWNYEFSGLLYTTAAILRTIAEEREASGQAIKRLRDAGSLAVTRLTQWGFTDLALVLSTTLAPTPDKEKP